MGTSTWLIVPGCGGQRWGAEPFLSWWQSLGALSVRENGDPLGRWSPSWKAVTPRKGTGPRLQQETYKDRMGFALGRPGESGDFGEADLDLKGLHPKAYSGLAAAWSVPHMHHASVQAPRLPCLVASSPVPPEPEMVMVRMAASVWMPGT